MLYIASAITPTPVIDSLRVSSLTSPNSTSLVVAKLDRIEVWDIEATGLVWRADLALWGKVVSIAQPDVEGARTHILVLTSPPEARIYLVTFESTPKPKLVVTSSVPLHPPTPSLREAEFCQKIVAQGQVALVSLWAGVLSCIELDIEKEKDVKKRRPSVVDAVSKRMVIRDNFNINLREHNLLDIAFMPPRVTNDTPSVAFLWQAATGSLLLQVRDVSLAAHSFTDFSSSENLATPGNVADASETSTLDFNDIPYSCPAARCLLPISPDHILVMGDEHSVLYTLALPVPHSPKISRASVSSASGTATSPRASAFRRSPQNEMAAPGKRRKSSMNSSRSPNTWELRPVWRVRQGFGVILASTVIESHATGASVLMSDESGQVTAIGWELEKASSSSGSRGSGQLTKIDLGKTSPASSMTYLDSSHVFVSSAYGDAVVLQIKLSTAEAPTRSPKTSPVRPIAARKGKSRARENEEGAEWSVSSTEGKGSLEIKERWMNLAPLKDFVVVEDEGGGVSHLVAASGASTSNSLRIIRSGVGLEEVLSLEGLAGVAGLFPLTNEGTTRAIVVSMRASTALLQLGSHVEMQPLDSKISALPSICAASIDGSSFFLVNPQALHVYAGSSIQSSWTVDPSEEIVNAASSGKYVAIAKKGGAVAILSVDARGITEMATIQTSGEVSSVCIFDHQTLPSPIVAIANWSGETLLYSLDQIHTVDVLVTPVEELSHAVSLMMIPSSDSDGSSGVRLLSGLADGSLVVYELKQSAQGGGITVASRKLSSLGSRPTQIFPVDGLQHGEEKIIAVGLSERMSIIFESKGRVDFSAVSRKDVTAATSVIGGSNSLALATSKGVSFETVTSLKKLSIQTMDLAERSPIKLTSLTEEKLLGVGSVSRKMDRETGDIVQSAHFELRDPNNLELLVEMAIGQREEITCLASVLILGRRYVAIGTAVISEDEDDYASGTTPGATGGKLHLVEPRRVKESWEISVKTTYDTVGPVHDAKAIHGFLAVAAGSKVSILGLDPARSTFSEISNFASTFIASRLYVAPASKLHGDDRLVVGDGMRSIFVLEVDEASGAVFTDQRDLATHRVTAMTGVKDGGEGVIIADGYSNLLTLRLNESIESAASFGLHEDVTTFRNGSLVPATSAPDAIQPELLYATIDGRLGIIGELTRGATRILSDLQRNMDKYVKGPGGVEWKTWRRGGTELIKKETAGFIDGDYVQRIIDLDIVDDEEQKQALEGTNQHERVMKLDNGGKAVLADKVDVVGVLQAVGGLH